MFPRFINAAQSELQAKRALSGFGSWRALAGAIGLTHVTVWKVLSGRSVRRSSLERVAAGLHMPVDRLSELIRQSRGGTP